MIRVRSMLMATAATALVLAAGSAAQAQALAGKWSSERGCGAQSRQIVFRGNTMELWDQNQRLFSGTVRYQDTGNQTAVTVVGISRETPPQPGSPEVGDVATFRRAGNRMYGVSVTRNGRRQTAPEDTPPFYLCP
jgi:hypothetical protein